MNDVIGGMSRGLAGGAARDSAGPGPQKEVRGHRHPHPRRRVQVGSARCTVHSSHGPGVYKEMSSIFADQ